MLNKDLKPAATYTRTIDNPELKGTIQIDVYDQPFLSTQSQGFYARVLITDQNGNEWGHGLILDAITDGEKALDEVVANPNKFKSNGDLTQRMKKDEISG